MKKRPSCKSIFLLPALLSSACVAPAGEETGDGTAAIGQIPESLYYDADRVWSSPSISVCWRSSAHSTQRGWVKAAVEAAFEPLTNISFTGWSTCSGSGAEIAIEFDNDEWPRSSVGERSASMSPSMYLNPFADFEDNNDDDEDGDLGVPGFQSCYADSPGSGNPSTGVTGKTWPSYRRRCIEAIAVHEFFHAVAVHHEQGRDDTPDFCSDSGGAEGETAYGYWDLTSVSNYCNPAWNGDGLLSPLDLSGMLTLYGAGDSNDYAWYSVGNVADYGSAPIEQLMFDIRGLELGGNYVPLTGDFDGDGEDDILYYGPGTETDRIRFGKTDRTFATGSVTEFNGTYVPITGDFDGDGRHDVFFYNPGTANDYIRWGRSDRTFDEGPNLTVDGSSYIPLAGDFDGDGRDDIFLYNPGTGTDYLRWGRSDRSFDNGSMTVDGSGYIPLAGDFDDDGRDDIFLYKPGTGNDFMRWGRSDRSFDNGPSPTVNGTYVPTTGDFDGNGTSDILWSGTTESDPVWLFDDTRNVFESTKTSSVTSGKPFSGDFDGDGLTDVLWYQPG